MTKLHPSVAEHYAAYKRRWDSLPSHVQSQIKAIISTAAFEQNGQGFTLGFTMGCNVMLEHTLNWVNTALTTEPESPELLTLKDMVSWTLIALFLQTYEVTLLEQLDTTKGLAN